MAIEANKIGSVKRFNGLTAGQIISIYIDGVEDTEMTYTVPADKTAMIDVSFNGEQEDIV